MYTILTRILPEDLINKIYTYMSPMYAEFLPTTKRNLIISMMNVQGTHLIDDYVSSTFLETHGSKIKNLAINIYSMKIFDHFQHLTTLESMALLGLADARILFNISITQPLSHSLKYLYLFGLKSYKSRIKDHINFRSIKAAFPRIERVTVIGDVDLHDIHLWCDLAQIPKVVTHSCNAVSTIQIFNTVHSLWNIKGHHTFTTNGRTLASQVFTSDTPPYTATQKLAIKGCFDISAVDIEHRALHPPAEQDEYLLFLISQRIIAKSALLLKINSIANHIIRKNVTKMIETSVTAVTATSSNNAPRRKKILKRKSEEKSVQLCKKRK